MINRSKERIKQTGEVFTPLELVDEILDKLPSDLFKDPSKTFLDPAAGDGNFLVRVIAYKMKNGSTPTEALQTTYGVDLMPDNTARCRERLLEIVGDTDNHQKIVNHNIVCSDAFEWDFENWKPLVSDDDKKTDILDDLLQF